MIYLLAHRRRAATRENCSSNKKYASYYIRTDATDANSEW